MKAKTIFLCVLILPVAGTALATEVSIKGTRDRVDLDSPGFQMTELDSRLVSEIHYDADRQYAVVRVRGGYYQKCGLSQSDMDAWLADESPSQYYMQYVKDAFDCD
jgi:hypothetical protein